MYCFEESARGPGRRRADARGRPVLDVARALVQLLRLRPVQLRAPRAPARHGDAHAPDHRPRRGEICLPKNTKYSGRFITILHLRIRISRRSLRSLLEMRSFGKTQSEVLAGAAQTLAGARRSLNSLHENALFCDEPGPLAPAPCPAPGAARRRCRAGRGAPSPLERAAHPSCRTRGAPGVGKLRSQRRSFLQALSKGKESNASHAIPQSLLRYTVVDREKPNCTKNAPCTRNSLSHRSAKRTRGGNGASNNTNLVSQEEGTSHKVYCGPHCGHRPPTPFFLGGRPVTSHEKKITKSRSGASRTFVLHATQNCLLGFPVVLGENAPAIPIHFSIGLSEFQFQFQLGMCSRPAATWPKRKRRAGLRGKKQSNRSTGSYI